MQINPITQHKTKLITPCCCTLPENSPFYQVKIIQTPFVPRCT